MTLRFIIPVFVAAMVGGGLLAGFNMTHSKQAREGAAAVETDSPDEALKWRRLAWVDEHGKIPKDAIANARAEYEALARRRLSPMAAGNLWEHVGPKNVAGRSRSLLIHPVQSNLMWMGSVSGGIWKSENYGASWKPVDDRLPSLAIGCMAMDPKDPNVMYAGTGEGFFNSDAIFGTGILQSVDGGDTWNLLPSTRDFGAVNRIAISPDDSKVILAAGTGQGICRSTDGGQTWNVVLAATCHQVVFDPSDGQKAMATVLAGTGGHCVYSRDGGNTWTLNSLYGDGFAGRIELAYAPSNTSIVYAAVGPNGTIYKSLDGGVNFFKISSNPIGGTQWWYDNAVWVDSTNANRVVVGGVHLFKSEDGGRNFSQISSGYIMTDQVHPDVHFITSAPGYGLGNKRVYVCTDGGVFVTDDITKASTTDGWRSLANEARTTQYYGAAGEAITGRIVGGLQDNGTLVLERGSSNARMTFGGDGGFSAIDPIDPNYLYGEYVNLQIHRSTNGGQSSENIYAGIADAGNGAKSNFIAPIALDLGDPNILYGGGASLWRSMNAKAATPTWTEIKEKIVLVTNPEVDDIISSIAIAPDHSNTVWVGYNDGRVYKTNNATWDGPTWRTVDDNLDDQDPDDPQGPLDPLPNRYVTRILIDPVDVNTVYVCFGGFSENNLWVTHDAGATWAPLSGTGLTALPAVPIRAIARNPKDATTIIVGTEVGVCMSTDAGLTWSASTFGPANVSIDEINHYAHSNKLLVTTHGRGLWLFGKTQPVYVETPGSMYSGTEGTCTVYLDGNAPANGFTIPLTASNTNISIPTAVVVPPGMSTASFKVVASEVDKDTYAYVTATLNGGKSRGQILIHKGPGTLGLSVSPKEVFGGASTSVRLTVTTENPAPIDGWSISLASLDPTIATTATTVKIPNGRNSASVAVKTKRVNAISTARFNASLFSLKADTTLTVLPAPELTLLPKKVVGGSDTVVTATITLPTVASSNGVQFTLASSDPSVATTPSTVTVAAGEMNASFTVSHHTVGSKTGVQISAMTEGIRCSANLVLYPPTPTLSLQPAKVVGGSAEVVVGTVTLSQLAPNGGVVVKLTSANATLAAVPASIVVPEGTNNATFTVTHKEVTNKTTVALSVATGVTTKKAVLTLVPPPAPVALWATPSKVRGGSSTVVTGTVKLASVAPTGGIVVKLASLDKSLLEVPATVTVASGQQLGSFTIQHFTVPTTSTGRFTATTGIRTIAGSLTLLTPAVVGFTLDPAKVTGGTGLIGHMTISSPAPPGGFVLTTTIDHPAIVTAPGSAFIAPGRTTGDVVFYTTSVLQTTYVKITVSLGGTSRSAVLRVTP